MAEDTTVSLSVEVRGSEEAAAQFDKVKQALQAAGLSVEQTAQVMEQLAASSVKVDESANPLAISFEKIATEMSATLGESEKVDVSLTALNGTIDEFVRIAGANTEGPKLFLEGVREEAAASRAEFEKMGPAGADALKVLDGAIAHTDELLASLEPVAADVGATLAQLGDVGKTGLASLDAAIDRVTGSLSQFYAKQENGSQVTARDIAKITQSMELFRASIIEAYGSIEQATPAAQAALQRLEGEYQRATVQARSMINATRDHNVQLQETGDRIAGLGNSIQMLTAGMPGVIGQVGQMAGMVANAGAGVEKLKDSVGGLSLANASGAASFLRLGGTVGAVIVVFTAAVKGLFELQKQMGMNEQAINSIEGAFRRFGSFLKNDLLDDIHGLALATASLGARFIDLSTSVLAGDDDQATESLEKLKQEIDGLGVAVVAGKTGYDGFNAAIKAGVPEMEAAAASAADLQEIGKFTAEAANAGAAGQRLLNEAYKEGNGNAAALAAVMNILKPQLDDAVKAEDAAKGATEGHATALGTAAKAANDYAEGLKKSREELEKTSAKQVDETIALVQAGEERRAQIAYDIEMIEKFLPESDLHSQALKQLADQLQDNINKEDGFTKAQRATIESLIEAAKKGGDLTEAQKQEAKQAADAAEAALKLKTSHDELQVTWNNGVATISQVKSQQDGLKTSLEGTAKATDAVGTGIGNVGKQVSDHAGDFIKFTENADAGKKAIETLAKDGFRFYIDDAPSLHEKINESIDHFNRLRDAINGAASAADAMNKATTKLATE